MTTTTKCADCHAVIQNPRFTLIRCGRRLALCLDCIAYRAAASKRVVISDTGGVIPDDVFDDDDAPFALGVGQ